MEQKSQQEQMEDKQDEKEIRHTISAEETFTLAKDVYDLRCVIKNIWANRAVISRRLNITSLIVSILFTAIYALYVIFSGVVSKLSLGWEIAVYAVVGVFMVLVVMVLVLTVKGESATTKSIKKYGKTIKIIRYAIKIASLVMAVIAIVFTNMTQDPSPIRLAVDTVFLILSVLIIVFQTIGILCGGLGGLARWLLSPVKIKTKFSVVVLEWYQLLTSGENTKSVVVKKVNVKYKEDIGRVIDTVLVPILGKKKITNINAGNLLTALSYVEEADKAIAEGTLKNVFAYAEECGYVVFNPCRDMQWEGTIEVQPKKTFKEKMAGLGLRIAKSYVKKQLGAAEDLPDLKADKFENGSEVSADIAPEKPHKLTRKEKKELRRKQKEERNKDD